MNFESLWLQYKQKIQTFLVSKISDPVAREDVLQDILIKSYSNIHTLKAKESIGAWLWQITNRSIIDYYRQNNHHQALIAASSLAADSNQPIQQEQTIWRELTLCIEPFLQEMSSESKELLMAIDVNGASQKEYAQERGIDYSTLKSRVQKSRSDLKKLFQKCCDYQLDACGNIMEYQIKSGSCKNC